MGSSRPEEVSYNSIQRQVDMLLHTRMLHIFLGSRLVCQLVSAIPPCAHRPTDI